MDASAECWPKFNMVELLNGMTPVISLAHRTSWWCRVSGKSASHLHDALHVRECQPIAGKGAAHDIAALVSTREVANVAAPTIAFARDLIARLGSITGVQRAASRSRSSTARWQSGSGRTSVRSTVAGSPGSARTGWMPTLPPLTLTRFHLLAKPTRAICNLDCSSTTTGARSSKSTTSSWV
jgi:hypothetical protein